jgi:hypothetical protein
VIDTALEDDVVIPSIVVHLKDELAVIEDLKICAPLFQFPDQQFFFYANA